MSQGVITITDEQLSNMARADGIHDFGTDGPKDENSAAIFNNSVPVKSNKRLDEDECLDLVLGESAKERLGSLLFAPPPKEPNFPTVQSGPIHVGKFSLGTENSGLLGNNIGLDARKAVFVVDFNQHGFLSKLKQGTPNGIDLYYVLTPEVINDPAPKTSYTDEIFSLNAGFHIIPCIEVRKTPISFPGGSPNKYPHTKFFSNYTHALSPIRDIEEGKPLPKKLVVDLSITTPKETKVIKDSKKQNSIKSLLSFLSKLLGKLKDLFSATPEIATKWTQKRGGDWFQAIAAMDMKGRRFINALDNSVITIDEKVPVYFVTHDRIALAYALFVGCNVIFLTTDENVCYVFARQPGADLTEFYNEELKKINIQATSDTLTSQINTLTTATTEHSNAIQSMLSQFEKPETTFKILKELLMGTKETPGVLTRMVEYTYMMNILNRYLQLAEGLKSDVSSVKYMSYLNAKDIKEFNIETFKNTDVHKAVKAWTADYIPNRKRGITVKDIVTDSAEKTDAYVFLPYIADLSNSDALKHIFANAFYSLALKLKDNSLPALSTLISSREHEKAGVSIGSLAIQVYVYLRYNETSEEQRKNAQLLIDFSSYVPPADVEAAVLEGIGSDTLSSSQIYIPLLQAQNVAANAAINAAIRGGEKRKREEAETPTLNPYSPILVLMYALETCVPELEQSPDVRVYAQYIKFIENLLQDLNSNKKRYAVWEVLFSLNTTRQGRLAIAQALGLTPEQYRPYAMISHAFSDYLFGAFRGYDFRPAARLLQVEDIKVYLSTAAQNANASTYADILQSYKNIRTTLGFVEPPSTPVAAPPGSENILPMTKKTRVETISAAPRGDEPTTSIFGFGGKTYRRKLKRSKSSRHTKRAHRSDLAKGSETQSSH